MSYSLIVAFSCIVLAAASLYFPSRGADASFLGVRDRSESELFVQRMERRCQEVGGKWDLTARENEILLLLAQGKSRSAIAEELTISEETVKSHIKHIYAKTDVRSLRELVVLVETGVH